MNTVPPDFAAIANRLRERIAAGHYSPGDLIPSEWALCRDFGVRRTTVRRALSLIESDGLVITIPARGRVVKGKSTAILHRHQQIAHDLRERIEQGEFPPGSPVPSEAALRRQYGASRNTVRRALYNLEQERLVVARHGSGRYVSFPERPERDSNAS
ncbi:GntR family transcriptional regulator [Planobispora longispora]|uniref:GntR family transcriptional regulator n=1 Tax=Planobispora longispora TaxID=28887 RepID=UPI0019416405|nr:winged helix-turn-helix domain-containing protein [Planobispora longispora]